MVKVNTIYPQSETSLPYTSGGEAKTRYETVVLVELREAQTGSGT